MEASIFSRKMIEEKAKEIAGINNVDIKLQSPGHILIKIECKSDAKYKEFKEWINTNKPLGAKVTFCRKL
ncbi:hypothetical protein [Anaerosalibacter sp. Marseille-P3206]|uniref:hypothetical protein n=1 Tax=Anaerosalibacter sp. Marseille-P3206 TaxID=1871005 RepID=UPI0009878A71|nr:hypothetical protein [Anaerosalibacter sp. Marseille-P3206]